MLSPLARRTGNFRAVSVPVLIRWSFYVYLLAWFWQVGVRKDWLRAIRFEFLLGAGLTALAIVLLTSGLPRPVKGEWPKSLISSAILLVFLIAVMVPFSIVPDYSAGIFVDRVLKFAAITLFVVAFVRNPDDLRALVVTLLIAWGYLTLESFRGALTGAMIWENQGVPRLHGDTPMFQHPNSLAGMAAGALPFLFFVFLLVRRLWQRALLAMSAVTALGCVMFSGSRTAYVGLVMLCVYFGFATSRSMFRAVGASVLVLGLAFVVLPSEYQARALTVVRGQEIEGDSMGARTEILRDAVAVFIENPLGVGVGAFPEARQRMFGRVQDTHNLYLEVATNLGVQGLCVFLVFVTTLLRLLWRVVKRCESAIKELRNSRAGSGPDEKPDPLSKALIQDYLWIRAAALAVVGYLLVRLVVGLFGMDLYEIYWWLSTGFAIVLWRMTVRLDARETEKRSERRG